MGLILADLHFNDCICHSVKESTPRYFTSVQETQINVPLSINGQNNGFYQSSLFEQHFVDDLGDSQQFTLDRLNLELQTDTARVVQSERFRRNGSMGKSTGSPGSRPKSSTNT